MDLDFTIKYVFEHDSQNRLKSWERTYDGKRTSAKYLYEYDKNNLSKLIADYGNGVQVNFKYSKNTIEVTTPKGTFVQTIKYDRHKNITSVSEENTKSCETIDYFCRYEYY